MSANDLTKDLQPPAPEPGEGNDGLPILRFTFAVGTLLALPAIFFGIMQLASAGSPLLLIAGFALGFISIACFATNRIVALLTDIRDSLRS